MQLEAGLGFKPAIEGLLLALTHERADALQLLLKESRGAWVPFLPGISAGDSGGQPARRPRALFLGNAFSGAVPVLADSGYDVVVCEPSAARLAFGQHRNEHHVPGRCSFIVLEDPSGLPFEDGAFDAAVLEEGLPEHRRGYDFDITEVQRVTRSVLALTTDNRLGYKRSTGLRGVYRVPSPFEYLARALRAPAGERTLRGYRQLLRSGFDEVDAYSLYPHVRDFTHVVALDTSLPRLTVGPREKKNIVKVVGKKLGLFPVLTPSFGLIARRGEHTDTSPLAHTTLQALCRRLDLGEQELELCIATRSNTALWLTRAKSAAGAGLCVHLPLSPRKRDLLLKHHGFLERVRNEHPGVPVPAPLFAGEVGGLWLTCEQRLEGMSAPNVTGAPVETARFFRDVTDHFTKLILDRVVMDEERFERMLGDRFRLVQQHAGRARTAATVGRMLEELREQLIGRELPLALYHGDLRAKHIQIAENGRVVGYMDWGASERCFLPYIDLLHLVAHQRKQEEGCSPERTWNLIRERRELVEHERATLDSYAEQVSLEPDLCRSIEAVYPVLVAGMAEMNWDYSRPRWLHTGFGV